MVKSMRKQDSLNEERRNQTSMHRVEKTGESRKGSRGMHE